MIYFQYSGFYYIDFTLLILVIKRLKETSAFHFRPFNDIFNCDVDMTSRKINILFH
jgi:hypothetical protein